MQAIISSVKQEHTVLTEEDITLELTKEEIWTQKMKDNQICLHDQLLKEEENQGRQLSTFSFDQESQADFSKTQESRDVSLPERQRTKLEVQMSALKKPFDLKKKRNPQGEQQLDLKLQEEEEYSDLNMGQSFPSVSKEVNVSRQPKRVLFDQDQSNFAKHEALRDEEEREHQLRSKLREIDNHMRELNMERNRLKYFLRKEKNMVMDLDEDSFQTRECPCCGKLISKLCFKCEHIYCNVDNCPRKKKQKLNAKMLEKMREKKKGDGKRRRLTRSRDKDRSRKDQSDNNPKEDFSFLSFDELSFSDKEGSETESELALKEDSNPRVYETRNRVKETPDWKKTITLSDISLKESNLFMSSVQEDNS